MKKIWFLKLVMKLSGLFRPITLSSFLSVLSLTVGVATLLVSSALVDSYEQSFKESIQSVFSHAVLHIHNDSVQGIEEIKRDIISVYKGELGLSESHRKEGLLAHKGKVAGVILEGVSKEKILNVIDFKSKIIKGSYVLDGKEVDKNPKVLVGKDLFEKFDLELDSVFSVVIPQADYGGGQSFSRKVFTFKVGGVVDLGKHAYNRRFIIADLSHVNKASAKAEGHFSKVSIKIEDGEEVEGFKLKLSSAFSEKYWVQTWRENGGGLLEAIKIERWVIFFLVLILVVVAAFNVSTNLYLNLSKRLKDFSVLQTIGLSKKEIAYFMVLNGVALATYGIFAGWLLSASVIAFCNWLLESGRFVPPDVYKLTSIQLSLELPTFLIVAFATYLLCFLASLAPAFSVYKLSIVRGLRYE